MIQRIVFAVCLFLVVAVAGAQTSAPPALDQARAASFAKLALDCIEREYPNDQRGLRSVPTSAAATPAPAFYGLYDWHSSGTDTAARAPAARPATDFAPAARARRSATSPPKRRRRAGLPSNTGRNRAALWPGLVASLAAELRGWDDAQAREWAQNLAPLESEVVQRLQRWLPKLTRPIRVGEHTQTAFAFGLALDWAEHGGDAAFAEALRRRIREFYFDDRHCPLDYEPSGRLPSRAWPADLMRRVLAPREFAAWLDRFLRRFRAALAMPG
jgi:hypothetical protein